MCSRISTGREGARKMMSCPFPASVFGPPSTGASAATAAANASPRDATRTGMRTVIGKSSNPKSEIRSTKSEKKSGKGLWFGFRISDFGFPLFVLFLLQFVEHGFELLDRIAELPHLAFELAD